MTDTAITLTPANAFTSGPVVVTASAPVFAASDIGRALSLYQLATVRLASTAYAVGVILTASYAGVDRIYRVVGAGTTSAFLTSGTTPAYDLNAPRQIGLTIPDGTATLKYLGAGRFAWGFGIISGFTNSQTVTVTVDPRGTFAAGSATVRWKFGQWSAARGWPATATFHAGRTWWGGSTTRPQTVWASATNDFETFTPSEPDGAVLDNDGLTLSLDDDQVNTVRWLCSFPRGLAVGTASGEFTVIPANPNAALSATNARGVRQSDRGSDINNPVIRLNGAILFVQRGARKLRELQYDFSTDSFSTGDLTQLADHIAGAGFLEASYQNNPDGIVWLLRADGSLATLTYDREQKIRAWSRQVIGAPDGGSAIIESVAIVPAPDGASDDVYISVARTFNGVTARTIEVIPAPYRRDFDGDTGAVMVDCSLSYSGTAANTFSGLGHLEGQVVRIAADGSERNDRTVTGGSVVATGPAATAVHIGLPFTSRMQTLSPELATGEGTAQGQMRRVSEVSIRFSDSSGGQYGRLGGTLEDIILRKLSDPMNAPVPLFSGDKRVSFPAGWDRSAQVVVQTDRALPLTILALITEMQING